MALVVLIHSGFLLAFPVNPKTAENGKLLDIDGLDFHRTNSIFDVRDIPKTTRPSFKALSKKVRTVQEIINRMQERHQRVIEHGLGDESPAEMSSTLNKIRQRNLRTVNKLRKTLRRLKKHLRDDDMHLNVSEGFGDVLRSLHRTGLIPADDDVIWSSFPDVKLVEEEPNKFGNLVRSEDRTKSVGSLNPRLCTRLKSFTLGNEQADNHKAKSQVEQVEGADNGAWFVESKNSFHEEPSFSDERPVPVFSDFAHELGSPFHDANQGFDSEFQLPALSSQHEAHLPEISALSSADTPESDSMQGGWGGFVPSGYHLTPGFNNFAPQIETPQVSLFKFFPSSPPPP